jgi:hypothetical protein
LFEVTDWKKGHKLTHPLSLSLKTKSFAKMATIVGWRLYSGANASLEAESG